MIIRKTFDEMFQTIFPALLHRTSLEERVSYRSHYEAYNHFSDFLIITISCSDDSFVSKKGHFLFSAKSYLSNLKNFSHYSAVFTKRLKNSLMLFCSSIWFARKYSSTQSRSKTDSTWKVTATATCSACVLAESTQPLRFKCSLSAICMENTCDSWSSSVKFIRTEFSSVFRRISAMKSLNDSETWKLIYV